MRKRYEYQFMIGAHSPETFPMSRLAKYMSALAQLLGEPQRVHFVRLESGSTTLVQAVEPQAISKVRERIRALELGRPPKGINEALEKLNQYLVEDGAVGSLRESGSTSMTQFPSHGQPIALTFGPFRQPDTLDGVLIRIGGQEDRVPVHLQDGNNIHMCEATRELAKNLAVHLFGPTLRVRGEGRWKRSTDGKWLMRHFRIEEFDKLDDAPLNEVVNHLRSIKGSGWKDIDDPVTEIQRLRGSISDTH